MYLYEKKKLVLLFGVHILFVCKCTSIVLFPLQLIPYCMQDAQWIIFILLLFIDDFFLICL